MAGSPLYEQLFCRGRERRQTTNLTAVGNGHEPVLSVLSRDVVKKHRIPTRSFALSFASCAIACTFGRFQKRARAFGEVLDGNVFCPTPWQ